MTLVAFGNGSVDIFAAIAGMRQGKPDLVVGALLGGGAFVTLFVIGSIFAMSKKFKLQGQIFVRDCVFYLIAISWIFYCFVGPKDIALHDALGIIVCYLLIRFYLIYYYFFSFTGFLGFYLAYVIIVLLSKYVCKGVEQGGLVGHHGHGAPKQPSARKPSIKKEHKITFEGLKPDKDPSMYLVLY